MKFKMLILCLVFFLSCSGFTQFRDKKFYEDYSYEEIWQASIFALADFACKITTSDREGGLLQGYKSPDLFTEGEEFVVTITISEENGRVLLNCHINCPAGFYGGAEGRVRRLLTKIH